ncbi:MAG: hypothetical protein R6U61_04925 [Thermoplasmata archaeon]
MDYKHIEFIVNYANEFDNEFETTYEKFKFSISKSKILYFYSKIENYNKIRNVIDSDLRNEGLQFFGFVDPEEISDKLFGDSVRNDFVLYQTLTQQSIVTAITAFETYMEAISDLNYIWNLEETNEKFIKKHNQECFINEDISKLDMLYSIRKIIIHNIGIIDNEEDNNKLSKFYDGFEVGDMFYLLPSQLKGHIDLIEDIVDNIHDIVKR